MITPRRWQTQALEAWEQAGFKGIVSVVTGGGKTVFAVLAMRALFDAGSIRQVTILVPTVALQEQWWAALLVDGGVDKQDISFVGGSGASGTTGKYRIAVMASARTRMESWDLSQSLLVVDECHRAGSSGMLDAFQNVAKYALGLSATPEREYDEGLAEILMPAVGEIVFTYEYDEALKDGVISPFNLVNVKAPMTSEEEAIYGKLSLKLARAFAAEKAGNLPEGTSARIAIERSRMNNRIKSRIPVALAIMKSIGERRTIIFEESIERAHIVAETLARLGFRPGEYHSGVSTVMRREYMRQFRIGMISVLVTVHALDEGFDVPEAEVAIVIASSATRRQRIQRLGRVLRSTLEKVSATIFTIYSSPQEAQRLSVDKAASAAKSVTWQELQ
jgi:superfamily II DNA or RNA helicase